MKSRLSGASRVELLAARILLQGQALLHYHRLGLKSTDAERAEIESLRRGFAELVAAYKARDLEATTALVGALGDAVARFTQRREHRRIAHKPRRGRQGLTEALNRALNAHPTASHGRIVQCVLDDLEARGVENLPDSRTVQRRLKKLGR